MRPLRRCLVVVGITVALASGACSDIDPDAPGLDLSDGAADTVPDDSALDDEVETTRDEPLGEAAALTDAQADEAAELASDPEPCGVGESVTATIVNVEEWVRLRGTPTLDGDELATLPLGTEVQAWPNSLTFDDTDFWWITVQAADEGCGFVAGLFVDTPEGTLDYGLQGVAADVTDPIWSLAGRNQLGGALWEAPSGSISLHVTDDTIDAWLERAEAATVEFLESADGAGFSAPTEWFDEVEVIGADRAVRPVGFPSDDGANATLLAQVGTKLIVADSFARHDPPGPNDEIEAFLASIEVRDPALFSG